MNCISVYKECLDPKIITYILTMCRYLYLQNTYIRGALRFATQISPLLNYVTALLRVFIQQMWILNQWKSTIQMCLQLIFFITEKLTLCLCLGFQWLYQSAQKSSKNWETSRGQGCSVSRIQEHLQVVTLQNQSFL